MVSLNLWSCIQCLKIFLENLLSPHRVGCISFDSRCPASIGEAANSCNQWLGNFTRVRRDSVDQHGEAHRGSYILIPLWSEISIRSGEQIQLVEECEFETEFSNERHNSKVDELQPQNEAHD